MILRLWPSSCRPDVERLRGMNKPKRPIMERYRKTLRFCYAAWVSEGVTAQTHSWPRRLGPESPTHSHVLYTCRKEA